MADPKDPIGVDLNELKQSNDTIVNIRNSTGFINNNFQEINKNVKEFNSLTSQLNEALSDQIKDIKDINTEYLKYYELKQKVSDALKTIKTSNNKIRELEGNAVGDNLRALQIIKEGIKARRDLGEEISASKAAQEELNSAILKGNTPHQDLIDLKEKATAMAEKLQKSEEKSANLARLMQGEYQKIGLNTNNINEELIKQVLQLSFARERAEDIYDNHKNTYITLREQTTEWQKILSAVNYYINKFKEFPGVKAFLGFIQTQLNAIGIDFKSILNNVLKLDSLLVNFGKSVQVSKEGARTLADTFEKVSNNASSYNSNVSAAQASIKNQIEANNALNESLGTGALFTAKTRIDQIELVKKMGLQAETGAKIYQLGLLNRKTAHETAVAIGDQVVNFRKSTGITLDYRKVLTEVAKVSGQLAVQYKNNPELLAKAVIQAKELGLTLEQTAKMGDKLLDFPGSIESELKAELLTGKALNLEQARYLALMGDSAGAAKELMNNVGGLSEFQKLNVLQQRALAEAVGLTAGELADSLTQQELLKGTAWESEQAFREAAQQAARTGDYTKLNAELAQASNGKQLADQAAQIGNQEKFQMAIEKLQESLAMMVNGPLGKMIDKLATMTNQAGFLKSIFIAIGAIISIKMVSGLISVGKGIVSLIGPIAKFAKTASFGASALSLGVGLLASLAAYAIASSIIDSIVGGEASVGGGGVSGTTGVNTGAINVPRESSRPMMVEVKSENYLVVDGRTTQAITNKSTKQANSKLV